MAANDKLREEIQDGQNAANEIYKLVTDVIYEHGLKGVALEVFKEQVISDINNLFKK